jgi:hypothetical protein
MFKSIAPKRHLKRGRGLNVSQEGLRVRSQFSEPISEQEFLECEK